MVSWAFFSVIAAIQARAVDDDLDLLVQAVHFAEGGHQPDHVPQAGQIELRDQQDLGGHFQGHQVDAV